MHDDWTVDKVSRELGKPRPIAEIAASAGFLPEEWIPYGWDKAKIDLSAYERLKGGKQGKLVLLSAINPTPAGEGKTTVSIGLADALRALGVRAAVALREPSLGPIFGVKGGATGGGKAELVPMEDINMHFTGDLHAITAAHNLLAALIDNHLQQGNSLGIDPRRITWRRVIDMNDRALRHTLIGLGGVTNGIPREDGFDITVTSELMAILCLVDSYQALKEQVARIVIGYTYDKRPVTVGDLGAHGAVAALLKDALKPNLVQTRYGTPAFVHGGPFANIAHGTNSILATKMALFTHDVVVTEAGFGFDLGAEKYMHITTLYGGFSPDVIVIVATLRALKMHGGVALKDLTQTNVPALDKGLTNLYKHLETAQQFGVPAVVALNRRAEDDVIELEAFEDALNRAGIPYAIADVYHEGPEGGKNLAELVLNTFQEKPRDLKRLYRKDTPLEDKITRVARGVYGAAGVSFSDEARRTLAELEATDAARLPVCMAKTQYSLSDDPTRRGRPEGFTVHVRRIEPRYGAGFHVVYLGEIMTMPGLPRKPNALKVDLTPEGEITGLY